MVHAVNQDVPGQSVAVPVAPGGVHAPVFGDTDAGVQARLLCRIPFVGGFGGDFQGKVGAACLLPR